MWPAWIDDDNIFDELVVFESIEFDVEFELFVENKFDFIWFDE